MNRFTDVSFEYTGGGVYVFTAKFHDVWLMTDFLSYDSYGCYDAPLDEVEADILPNGQINYDGHWKMPSVPLPQWIDVMQAVKDAYGDDAVDEVSKRLPANPFCRIGEKELSNDPHSERLETLACIIELFEDFLEARGIDIPNEDKDQAIEDGEDPDSISLIYGCDYGALESDLEDLLIRLGMMEKEEF